MYFYFYVPDDHLEAVKSAVFDAGAGRIGHYRDCCWQTMGTGQFKPMAGSAPHMGELGERTRVAEVKVEMVCARDVQDQVRAALLDAHPYEEVAYGFINIET